MDIALLRYEIRIRDYDFLVLRTKAVWPTYDLFESATANSNMVERRFDAGQDGGPCSHLIGVPRP